MAPRNPRNPIVGPSFIDSSPATSMVADSLYTIWLEYHMFTHTICVLSPKEVLRSAQIEVSPKFFEEEVMVVYETRLKCALCLPLSSFLLQSYEGWEVCLWQLAPNAFTVLMPSW